MGTNESHPCAHCGKVANLVCAGCKEARYCSNQCQKESWGSHKTPCSAARARKAIYRAGDLAKAVSQIFNRATYRTNIKEMKKFGNLRIIYLERELKDSECALGPFPSALFPDKQDADAILEFQNCDAVLNNLHAFLKCLFKGQLRGSTSNETLNS